MGPFDDHNFKFVFDFGPTGKDHGKGGKYLVLPPDYDGEVPEGNFVFRSQTYLNFAFIRADAAVVGFGEKAIQFYRPFQAKAGLSSSAPMARLSPGLIIAGGRVSWNW